jgi:PhnB protein
MTRMVPYLTVHDAAGAIEFYAAAFGAKETGERYDEEDGRIGFVALEIDGAPLYLSDEAHEYGAYAPRTLGHGTASIVLDVDDAHATSARAVAAGATVDRPVRDQGDQLRGWVVDPYGHRWSICSPLP